MVRSLKTAQETYRGRPLVAMSLARLYHLLLLCGDSTGNLNNISVLNCCTIAHSILFIAAEYGWKQIMLIISRVKSTIKSRAEQRSESRGPLMAYSSSWVAEGTIPGRELEECRDHP